MNNSVIVASHRRSGTHFTIDTLFNNFDTFKMCNNKPYLNLDSIEETAKISDESTIFKTHSIADLDKFASLKVKENFDAVKNVTDKCKVIYVYRDGRDVLVSLFNYQKKYDKSLNDVTFASYIRQDNTFEKHIINEKISRVAFWAKHVSEWSIHSDVLLIEFSQLKSNLARVINKMEHYLDEKAKPKLTNVDLEKGVKTPAFKKDKSIVRSSISFNKGKNGAWVDYFTEDDLEFYYSEIKRYNLILPD
jgi:hypothetical protein